MIRTAIPVHEAIEKVLAHTTQLHSETVKLEDAYGRVLRAPIVASHPVPPFDRSAYDGYAVRSEDTVHATKTNKIAFKKIGDIGAGYVGRKRLQPFEAYRIMTGAKLPEGADAIIMLEHTETTEDGFTIDTPIKRHENISFTGEDAKEGEMLIEAGDIIHPGTSALLATFGYANVEVGKKPRVSILSTGTELLNVDEPLQDGKIRNSNGPMLEAQLKRMGIQATSYGMSEDNLDACTKIVEEALENSDVVMTTGGVSVGDYDYLPQIYERLGATVLFDKIMMRPGSVTTVAVVGDKLLFGLSGNPSACFTGFELYARPALLKMMGATKLFLPTMKASLGEDFTKANPFTRFIRASWDIQNGKIVASPAGFNKSNAVSSIARGNCIIVLPSGSEGYVKGAEIDVLLLGQEQGVAQWIL